MLKYDKPLSNHLRYVWIQIQYVKGKVIQQQKNKKLTIHQNSTSWKTDQMIVDYGGWFWRGRKTRGLVQHRAVRDTLLCDWDFRHPVTFTFYLLPQVWTKFDKYSLSLFSLNFVNIVTWLWAEEIIMSISSLFQSS